MPTINAEEFCIDVWTFVAEPSNKIVVIGDINDVYITLLKVLLTPVHVFVPDNNAGFLASTYVLLQNDYIGESINRVEITKDVLYDSGTQDTFDVKVKIQYIISIPSNEPKKIITYTEDEVWSLVNKLNNTLNIGSDLTLEQWFEKNKK